MSARIFVGLDYATTESDLLDKFEQWGAIKEIFLPKDFRGRCKGYGFIEFENSTDCAAAIEGADRTQLFGRTLRLEPATGQRTVRDPNAPPRENFNRSRGGFRNDREGGYRNDREGGRSFGGDREGREPRIPGGDSGSFREYSTLRPVAAGFMARRPVQLTQVNALVGRRMFGMAASLVLRKRIM